MYPLIVFLPLIAAAIAGTITLVGAMSTAKDARMTRTVITIMVFPPPTAWHSLSPFAAW